MGSILRAIAVSVAVCGAYLVVRSLSQRDSREARPIRVEVSPAFELDPNDWRIRLAGPTSPLEGGTQEVDLAQLETGAMVDERILPELRAMLEAASCDGYSLVVLEGYRTPEVTQDILEREVTRLIAQGMSPSRAPVEAARRVGTPTTDEHRLGLGVDIVTSSYFSIFDNLYEVFAQFPEYDWLCANGWRYGFVPRYPQGQEQVTGMSFLPWHFRYVGVAHAKRMTEEGLCLEEYWRRYAPGRPGAHS